MNRLLVVVDYQNDFVNGSLGFPEAPGIDAGIAAQIEESYARGDDILFTLDTHGDDYLHTREGRALPVPHCNPAAAGWQLYGKTGEVYKKINDSPKVHTLSKATFAPAPEAMVKPDGVLQDVDEVLLVGLVTNMCVISCAVMCQASWPQAQITVDASLCLSFDKALHEKSLDVMQGLQIKIINRFK